MTHSTPAPISNRIAAMAPEIAEWRRELHRYPELAYEEERTAAFVADKLRSFGCDQVETGIGRTGVVAAVHGAHGPAQDAGGAIMLRADMDALPIHEETGAEYASQTPGKMHACGHDGHTAMLLGAAQRLAETKAFSGTVYFCFQPAEEGMAGAKAMIDDGLFERFPARAVFGMHNWPGLPVGSFAVRPGPMLASADKFAIRLNGRGGHAAKPDRARDPLIAGAHLVTQLQTLVSRFTDPLQPAVLSVTTFHAGSAFNIIPDRAEITGTIRTFDASVQSDLKSRVERMARAIAESFEIEAELSWPIIPYPPTVNDSAMTGFVTDTLTGLVGDDAVKTEYPPTMGAEDFSFLAQQTPGCFVFVGNGDSASLHHPKFDFNDAAIPYGVAYWERLAQSALPIS
ncbi:MAG: M20 family metallopeptidase [Neomegalonema sp.]|nr:M20 family metallopeptidase [Neomegalonema sp.]